MVTLQEARQQVTKQRQTLQEKQSQVSEAQKRLKKAREALPELTQRRLRQGALAGLGGIQRRRAIETAKVAITGREALVLGYKGQLGEFEKQIAGVESQIRGVERQKSAFKTAEQLFQDKVPAQHIDDPLTKGYLQDLYQQRTLAIESFDRLVSDFETQNPTEKLEVDWKKMKIEGVESGAFGQSLSISQYNKKIAEMNKQLRDLPEISRVQDAYKTADISKIQDVGPMSTIPGITGDLFPRISATGRVVSEPEQVMTPMPEVVQIPPEQVMSIMPEVIPTAELPPPTVAGLPPTMAEQYALAMKERGIITGAISVTAGKAQSIAEQIALGRAGRYGEALKDYPPYQPTATGKLFGGVVALAPYVTPAAGPLMIGMGAEKLISPAGIREREELQKTLEERYKLPEKFAKEISYVPAVAEIGLGYLGVRGARFPKVPKKIVSETRPLDVVPRYAEVQRPVFLGEKPTVISQYRITREIAPPKEIIIPKEGEGLLFAEPRVVPPKYEVTATPGIVVGEEPFITVTTKAGKVVRMERIEGVSFKVVPTNVAEFGKLSKTQKFIWQRLAEDLAGRPVALENVPKILSKNRQAVQSYVESYKLGRIDISKEPTVHLLEPRTLGRRTRRAEAGTEFFKRVETPKYEVYEATTFFKDVTFPGARAAGVTPKMKGEILRIKEPLYLGEGEKVVDVFQPSLIKKTPLKDTFGLQKLKQEVVVTPKPFFKAPRPKGKPKPKVKLKVKEERISYVGFPTPSGKVIFEEAFERAPLAFALPTKVDYVTAPKQISIQIPSLISIQIPKVRVAERFVQKQIELTKMIPKEISLLAPKPAVRVREALKVREAVRPIQVAKPFLKQIPKPRLGVPGRPRPTPRPKPRPKPKPPVAIPFKGKPGKFLKVKDKVKEKIIPEIRRRGLWIPLGKVKTEKEALLRAKRKVLGTLAASLRLRRAGTGELIEIKNGSRYFRPSKRERRVLVQRRPMRLMAPGERREIVTARRGKTKWIK